MAIVKGNKSIIDPNTDKLYVVRCYECETTTVSKTMPQSCGQCGSLEADFEYFEGMKDNQELVVEVSTCICGYVYINCMSEEDSAYRECPKCVTCPDDDDLNVEILLNVLYSKESTFIIL